MQKLDLTREGLRKFGLAMSAAFVVIAFIITLRRRFDPLPFVSVSMGFLIFSLLLPVVLKPFYIIWMKFALILSWINTRLILAIIFYLVFTPVGLLIRLFTSLLDMKIEKNRESYWIRKEEIKFKPSVYEHQF